MEEQKSAQKGSRRLKIGIWVLAVILMMTSAVYQRLTGPTHPLGGSYLMAGQEHSYRLTRSGVTEKMAEVRIPAPGGEWNSYIHWKRYPTSDEFTVEKMTCDEDSGDCVAELPVQPAAGKIEYFLTIEGPGETIHIPSASDEETVILRYKDPVPAGVLIPHICLMFFAVLFGIRTGLAAIFQPSGMRWSAWVTLIGMTIGGMVLGPIVQKHAFGAYWTGWPFGGDLTDNKVLMMWIVWVLACMVIGFRPLKREWVGRILVVLASVLMMFVYLIPHSMRGSELNYKAVDSGVEAHRAIGTAEE